MSRSDFPTRSIPTTHGTGRLEIFDRLHDGGVSGGGWSLKGGQAGEASDLSGREEPKKKKRKTQMWEDYDNNL